MSKIDWDPERLLDHYIHDYLLKKNLELTANYFRAERNMPSRELAIDVPGGGFLSEWWSIFWEMFISRMSNKNHPPTAAPSMKIEQMEQNLRKLSSLQQHLQKAAGVLPPPNPATAGDSSGPTLEHYIHLTLEEEASKEAADQSLTLLPQPSYQPAVGQPQTTPHLAAEPTMTLSDDDQFTITPEDIQRLLDDEDLLKMPLEYPFPSPESCQNSGGVTVIDEDEKETSFKEWRVPPTCAATNEQGIMEELLNLEFANTSSILTVAAAANPPEAANIAPIEFANIASDFAYSSSPQRTVESERKF